MKAPGIATRTIRAMRGAVRRLDLTQRCQSANEVGARRGGKTAMKAPSIATRTIRAMRGAVRRLD